MTNPTLDSRLLAPLLSDTDTAELFSDHAAIQSMLGFESALARCQERLGLIPHGAGEVIAAAARQFKPDLEALARGSEAAGHPVAALVSQLRKQAAPYGSHVHAGATAQDVMDTALVMRLKVALARFDASLQGLIEGLAVLAEHYRDTLMAGRTRYQQAVPVTFGLKTAGWLLPLVRHRIRLREMRPRVLVVQFGGAAGTLSILRGQGLLVMEALARELDLGVPSAPWHAQRDGFAELAAWLSLLTSSLGKIGLDIGLLAQSEVGEVHDGSKGISSAMPHKSNPVRSETLVAIGRANANLLSGMHQAAMHEHERSGSAWTLEWLTLPQMAILTGAALRHASSIVDSLEVNAERMAMNIERSGRLALAEAAVLTLSDHVDLEEARRVVSEASRQARASGIDLFEILAQERTFAIDWESARDPTNWLGSAREFVDRAVAEARASVSTAG